MAVIKNVDKQEARISAGTTIGIGVILWAVVSLALVGFLLYGVYKILDKHGGEIAKAAAPLALL